MLFKEIKWHSFFPWKTREGMQAFYWSGIEGTEYIYSHTRAFIFFIIRNQSHRQRKRGSWGRRRDERVMKVWNRSGRGLVAEHPSSHCIFGTCCNGPRMTKLHRTALWVDYLYHFPGMGRVFHTLHLVLVNWLFHVVASVERAIRISNTVKTLLCSVTAAQ